MKILNPRTSCECLSLLCKCLSLQGLGVIAMVATLEGGIRNVSTKDALLHELEGLEPGSTVRLEAGEWRDLDILIATEGTQEAPVTLEAAEPGKAVLTGRTSIRLEGSHIIVRGLHFKGATPAEGREALVTFRSGEGKTASNCRLTELYFDHCNPEDPLTKYPWVRMYGHDSRIDHCRFEGQNHKGRTIQVRVHEPGPGHLIDHNYFLDRLPGEESNGYEVIQIGLSGDSMKPGNVMVKQNIFERCDGETEIISSKSFQNTIRGNLFLECQGTVTLRHGNDCAVIGNAFIGNSRPGTGGVRVVGSGHEVRNNLFSGLMGRTGGVVVLYCGIPDSPLNGYFAASDTLLSENIFHENPGNSVYLNGGYGQRNRVILPENVRMERNVFGKPGNGGAVAIAGWLRDLKLKDNLYDSGMETGIHAAEGLSPGDFVFRRNSNGLPVPYAVNNREVAEHPILSMMVPDSSEVGPSWLVDLPELALIQHDNLVKLRSGQSEESKQLRASLVSSAKAIIEAGRTYSVTFNDRIPPSGDKRDYYSTGPYWWPNPETGDGLPYVRIDGKFNPQRDKVSDRQPLHDMIRDVWVLSVASEATGNPEFGKYAAKLLRVWFLDELTGMNPNLNHAQAIPGRTDGRGTGIIDTHPFAELVDALVILESSGSLKAHEIHSLKTWFGTFTEWLLTSENGRDERNSLNNHGTAYDLQAAALLWYTGQEERLTDYLSFVTLPRIGSQITADGRQPRELARTRTWSYCTENLEHFFKLGLISRKAGVDLFDYKSEEGGTLWKALDYLIPYVCNPDDWPHPQETRWQDHFIRNVLSIATGMRENESYERALDCLVGTDTDKSEQGASWAHPGLPL